MRLLYFILCAHVKIIDQSRSRLKRDLLCALFATTFARLTKMQWVRYNSVPLCDLACLIPDRNCNHLICARM